MWWSSQTVLFYKHFVMIISNRTILYIHVKSISNRTILYIHVKSISNRTILYIHVKYLTHVQFYNFVTPSSPTFAKRKYYKEWKPFCESSHSLTTKFFEGSSVSGSSHISIDAAEHYSLSDQSWFIYKQIAPQLQCETCIVCLLNVCSIQYL